MFCGWILRVKGRLCKGGKRNKFMSGWIRAGRPITLHSQPTVDPSTYSLEYCARLLEQNWQACRLLHWRVKRDVQLAAREKAEKRAALEALRVELSVIDLGKG